MLARMPTMVAKSMGMSSSACSASGRRCDAAAGAKWRLVAAVPIGLPPEAIQRM